MKLLIFIVRTDPVRTGRATNKTSPNFHQKKYPKFTRSSPTWYFGGPWIWGQSSYPVQTCRSLPKFEKTTNHLFKSNPYSMCAAIIWDILHSCIYFFRIRPFVFLYPYLGKSFAHICPRKFILLHIIHILLYL